MELYAPKVVDVGFLGQGPLLPVTRGVSSFSLGPSL
jgi:hypothetical protein